MNAMEKFNGLAEKYLLPISNKIANQRHLSALKDGMVASIPLSILGGLCLIIATPPFKPDQLTPNNFFTPILMGWYNWAMANAYALKVPFNMTMGLMGLFIAFSIAYHLSKHYKLAPLDGAILATVTFLIVSAPSKMMIPMELIKEGMTEVEMASLAVSGIPTTFLDAKGIFTAIIVCIGSVEILNFLMKRNIRFKMPDGVPPAIASSFDAILPLILSVGTFYGLSLVVQNLSNGQLIPSVIMKLLAPAMTGLDSLWGICLITIIAQVFWFFGLHGASITQFIRLPFMSAYIIANARAFELGEPITHYFTQPMWSYIIAIGGGGSTLSLVILMMRMKSTQIKQLGRLSFLPSIFNINEPIIFGMPMVLNPIMMIPFIFVPVVNAIIAYVCMNLQIVGKGIVETPWTTPAPIGAALGTMDYRTGIMVVLLILLDMLLYYPFLKVLDKQKCLEEQGASV